MSRDIAAYQLSLLGEPPKPCLAWRPAIYTWTFGGVPMPLSDDALRQAEMLHRESSPPAERSETDG